MAEMTWRNEEIDKAVDASADQLKNELQVSSSLSFMAHSCIICLAFFNLVFAFSPLLVLLLDPHCLLSSLFASCFFTFSSLCFLLQRLVFELQEKLEKKHHDEIESLKQVHQAELTARDEKIDRLNQQATSLTLHLEHSSVVDDLFVQFSAHQRVCCYSHIVFKHPLVT